MNSLFSTIYSTAVARSGGSLTGTLTTQALLPDGDNTRDLGSAALSYKDAWFDGTVTMATMSVTTLTCTECVGPTQLAATAVSAAAYGSSTAIPTFTVDADGRLTAAGTVTPQLTFTSTYFSSLSLASGTGLPISTGVSGLGTGVATALAVNVGSSGAFTTWGSASTFGALTSTTLDTGQGANELYDMDQNVLTTSSPTFAALTVDNINIDLNTINATSGNLALTTTVGAVLIEDISVNAGVITGATSITSTAFVGALTGNVTGNVSGSSGSTTGNAATATALQTARAINGVNFDGTAAITVTVPVATGITGLGTGVAAALAVNIGSAGAPVLFNGAGGTPSSITLTNGVSLPETGITDGSILARLAANETVTGDWQFTNASTTSFWSGAASLKQVMIGRTSDDSAWTAVQTGGQVFVSTAAGDVTLDARASGTANLWLGNSTSAHYLRVGDGTTVASGTLAWGGGSAISSSSNVALLNATQSFTGSNTFGVAYIDGAAGELTLKPRDGSGSNMTWFNPTGDGLNLFSSGTGTSVLTVTQAGLLAVSGFGTHGYISGGTGVNGLDLENTTDGTGNFARLRVIAGTTLAALYSFSQSYTTSGYYKQAGTTFEQSGVGGLQLVASNASGDVTVWSRGALAATFGASQATTFTGPIIAASTSVAITCDSATNNNDLNIGNATVVTLTTAGTGSCLVTGFTGGTPGRILYVLTPSNDANNITSWLKATGSSASNQIVNYSGPGITTLAGNVMMVFVYTGTKWSLSNAF